MKFICIASLDNYLDNGMIFVPVNKVQALIEKPIERSNNKYGIKIEGIDRWIFMTHENYKQVVTDLEAE